MGQKILKYLRATSGYYMKVTWGTNQLVLYPDAAFAPSSSRSQTGWVITYGGTPVLWRSTRQATTALSTAEAELNAILEGSVAMLGVEAMLLDISETAEDKVVGSDSMSALCLSSGTGSWRTRHLRIKASWLQEAISSNLLRGQHVPGIRQPADMLTKSLPSQRMRDLLRLWWMADDRATNRKAMNIDEVKNKVMVAMLCCMLMVTRASAAEADIQPIRTIQIDWDVAGVIMALLMVLGALVVWEFFKWACMEVVFEYAPGASRRKLRKLEKLRDATARAIEKELNRREREGMTSTPLDSAVSTSRRTTTPTPRRTSVSRPSSRPRTPPPRTARPRTPSPRPVRPSSALSSGGTPTHTSSTPPRPSMMTPTRSPGDHEYDVGEISRVCHDTASLMRMEELRDALRIHGQPTTGLKVDLARRLGNVMSESIGSSTAPTVRQLRYILWLWRHHNLQGRVLLRWDSISSRTSTSATIHAWSNL